MGRSEQEKCDVELVQCLGAAAAFGRCLCLWSRVAGHTQVTLIIVMANPHLVYLHNFYAL